MDMIDFDFVKFHCNGQLTCAPNIICVMDIIYNLQFLSIKLKLWLKPVLLGILLVQDAQGEIIKKNFLEELKDEELPSDINFFCILSWLSRYNLLNRFVDLFDPISIFLKGKERTYSELADDEWLQNSMFFTDVMEHLQTLNL